MSSWTARKIVNKVDVYLILFSTVSCNYNQIGFEEMSSWTATDSDNIVDQI